MAFNFKNSIGPLFPVYLKATSPSGKAGVCKTLIAGSNPAVASNIKKVRALLL